MKNYFNSNIQYYLRHLQKSGCQDPVQEVITDFVSYMKNSINDKQKDYIVTELKDTQKKRTVDDIIILLQTVKVNETDKKTLKLIEEGLKSLL